MGGGEQWSINRSKDGFNSKSQETQMHHNLNPATGIPKSPDPRRANPLESKKPNPTLKEREEATTGNSNPKQASNNNEDVIRGVIQKFVDSVYKTKSN